ncbi:MAG: 16S rRNA (guanine(527)-N(7))-methyltransferase RsmG, partial [Planctomycetaceae bacterium]|jgi:16S rRNA (guanine527-N7)-methyltransferase|nr:16S rRNA (guanine(527)-N(7))-methyltransferase RsmG [Planctomycetaceae bacterium]
MELLLESLKLHNISLPKKQIKQLHTYCQLLWDWNSQFNLTRHLTFERFVARDLIDSIAISEFLQKNEHILDVGSGGGVPGIILKIIRPDLNIELCDSTGKKALALSEIANELELDVNIHHEKAESILANSITKKNKKYTPQNKKFQKTEQETEQNEQKKFTTLTIRAVAKLTQLLKIFSPHWTLFDRLLLIKGPNWVNERSEARHLNLMNKLALRILKTYPTQINTTPQNQTQNNTNTINSVILQICQKNDIQQLEQIINKHKINTQKIEKQKKYHHKPK